MIEKYTNSYNYEQHFYDYSTLALGKPISTQNYEILQVADTYNSSKFLISPHVQVCDIEFTFVCNDELTAYTDDSPILVNGKEIFFIFKKDSHKLTGNRACRFLTIAFNIKGESPYRELYNMLLKGRAKVKKAYMPEMETEFLSCITRVMQETVTPSVLGTAFIDAIITKILASIVSCVTGKTEHVTSQDSIANEARLFIDVNFCSIASVNEVASYVGHPYNSVLKEFKNFYHISLHSYLLNKKMEYAKELLSGGMKSSAVAEKLNYTSPYNFSRAFKSHFGVYPSFYSATKSAKSK